MSQLEWVSRFWSRVAKVDVDDCWVWIGGCDGNGYGAIQINGRNEKAHRASYILENGPIPTGLVIRHKCDNPPCVNPRHLETGTPADNNRDMMERGRHRCGAGSRHGSRTHPERFARGERHGRAKLEASQVIQIRADKRQYKAIAADFGIKVRTVVAIKKRQTWKHIK